MSADLEARNECGETPLCCAVESRDHVGVANLVAAGADMIASGALHMAIAFLHKGSERMVEVMVGAGADLSATYRGRTALDCFEDRNDELYKGMTNMEDITARVRKLLTRTVPETPL